MCLPVMLLSRLISHTTCFKVVYTMLLITWGPLLLVMNILGCISGSINFEEFCKHSVCGTPKIYTCLTVISWECLYCVSLLFCFQLIKKLIKIYRRKLEVISLDKWREIVKSEENEAE